MILAWFLNNWAEVLASVLGIIGVWLTAKQNIWCWFLGLLNVILSLYVFFISKLYADVLLQVFYLVMTSYGWYNWLYGGENKTVLKVSKIKAKLMLFLIFISVILIFIAGYLFSHYTDAALPYWDATVAVWGVIGTFIQAKKILESWIIWILTDLLCTGIYFYKGLFAFTVLYFVFALLAVYGYVEWRRDYRKRQVIL